MNRAFGFTAIWTLSFFSCALAGQCQTENTVAARQATQEKRSALVQPEKWWDALPRPVYATLKKVGTFQNWFEVYELTAGTYAIYEPYQFEEAISYLVVGAQRAALVDSGNGIGDIRRVVGELTKLPVSVLLTHEHHDHSGGAHLFDDVAVYGNSAAIQYLRAGLANASARRYVTGDYIWKPLPAGIDPATWSLPGVEPSRLLEEAQIIDLGGRRLEVIYTPGHSPGSVCFLDRNERLLFTGDHFYPGPLYAHNVYTDVDAYAASSGKIAARVGEYDYVLGGHNEPWVKSDVIPRVDEAFKTIFAGEGKYSEDGELRRYRFEGFDIIIRTAAVRAKKSPGRR